MASGSSSSYISIFSEKPFNHLMGNIPAASNSEKGGIHLKRVRKVSENLEKYEGEIETKVS
jgi:hypothetical protein